MRHRLFWGFLWVIINKNVYAGYFNTLNLLIHFIKVSCTQPAVMLLVVTMKWQLHCLSINVNMVVTGCFRRWPACLFQENSECSFSKWIIHCLEFVVSSRSCHGWSQVRAALCNTCRIQVYLHQLTAGYTSHVCVCQLVTEVCCPLVDKWLRTTSSKTAFNNMLITAGEMVSQLSGRIKVSLKEPQHVCGL